MWLSWGTPGATAYNVQAICFQKPTSREASSESLRAFQRVKGLWVRSVEKPRCAGDWHPLLAGVRFTELAIAAEGGVEIGARWE